MQFYDPNKLITGVQELLRSHGLDPRVTDSNLAHTGACMLLRGLGAFPAIDAVDAYTHILDDGPWPDADDRRAARFTEQHASQPGLAPPGA
jgi:hypothetical protein